MSGAALAAPLFQVIPCTTCRQPTVRGRGTNGVWVLIEPSSLAGGYDTVVVALNTLEKQDDTLASEEGRSVPVFSLTRGHREHTCPNTDERLLRSYPDLTLFTAEERKQLEKADMRGVNLTVKNKGVTKGAKSKRESFCVALKGKALAIGPTREIAIARAVFMWGNR